MNLTVENVVKQFGSVTALGGVSLNARAGSPLGLLGRNGAGKTTLMRIIMNVFEADSGRILLDGKPIAQSGAKIGYLPEERGLYRKMPICEQLIYIARLRGMSSAEAKKACDDWLERLGMTEYRKSKPEVLSKGNQQRIQLALALINDPDIAILDEPFSGLDPVNALQLRSIVSDLASSGKIVIFSSHQMSAVEDFCEDIVILNKGMVVLGGSLSSIRAGYPHDKVRITAAQSSAAEEIGRAAALFGTVEPQRDGVTVKMNNPEQRMELLKVLVEKGIDIVGFETVMPTLEEIFVGAAGDEAAPQRGGEQE